MPTIFKVCIPHTFRDAFDYLAPAEQVTTAIGKRVWVPFRNSSRLGIIVEEMVMVEPTITLKIIESFIDDEAILDNTMLKLCLWISQYYQSPLSEVIPLALPKKYRLGETQGLPVAENYRLIVPLSAAQNLIPSRAKKLKKLLILLDSENSSVAKSTLIKAGYTSKQIGVLVELKIIELKIEPQPITVFKNTVLSEPLLLNHEQVVAFENIEKCLHKYTCFLLQGVTGSGKTEVYLQIVAKVLAQQKQVLILVPEIGLTPQLLARFTSRFQEPIFVIHSNLNDRERQIAWQAAKQNIAKLIIGTRAAIFTPMPNLGLIIIDEEHDSSLKQMDGVRYSARDTALIRAHRQNIPIILGTATPSLESLYNCMSKKYQLLRLNQKAMTNTPLHYQLIDIRNQNLQQGIAPAVLHNIYQHLAQRNQVLVFINRRGYAPVLLCHQCGWMADCTACASHLTVHRKRAQLICHHCGLTTSLHTHCLACKSLELVPIGLGTQRVFDYLKSQFPEHKILRIDRDSTNSKHGLEEQLNLIHEGSAELIIGTQMLAKGHHFPNLTLVIVLDADMGFFNQDFRALENLGQLLTQVAGRAGRAHCPGQVMIQTHIPQHPLLNILISQGYAAFAEALLDSRKLANLPPYYFLALIRAQAKTEAMALQCLHKIKTQLLDESITVLGPAPAPLARKAFQYRMQLLIKSPSRKKLQATLTKLRAWLTINNKITQGVRWNVDVDPMDLL